MLIFGSIQMLGMSASSESLFFSYGVNRYADSLHSICKSPFQRPPGTVKTRLLHARKKLRAVLEGDDHG